jgi:hypothetical protein
MSRPATRYEAAKLYLLGRCAEQALGLARRVVEALGDHDGVASSGLPPDEAAMVSQAAMVSHATMVYDRGSGCLSLLFRMEQLSVGVLPWPVCQGINETCADLAEHAGTRDRDRVLADARSVVDRIAWLERVVVPEWDVRARQ